VCVINNQPLSRKSAYTSYIKRTEKNPQSLVKTYHIVKNNHSHKAVKHNRRRMKGNNRSKRLNPTTVQGILNSGTIQPRGRSENFHRLLHRKTSTLRKHEWSCCHSSSTSPCKLTLLLPTYNHKPFGFCGYITRGGKLIPGS
jgi:hypothetical protein